MNTNLYDVISGDTFYYTILYRVRNELVLKKIKYMYTHMQSILHILYQSLIVFVIFYLLFIATTRSVIKQHF